MNTQRSIGARSDVMVHTLLDEAVAQTADAWAVRDAAGRWTYRQLDAHSRAFAAWLAAHGIARGERILVQLPSTRELVALFYGAARHGAVLVPVNTGMKDFHLRSVIENSEPALVVVPGGAVERIGALGDAPVLALETVWDQVTELRERAAHGPAAPGPAKSAQPEATEESEASEESAEDIAVLVYTSGSTAAPKAVVCPHGRMVFASEAIQLELGYRPDDVVFCRFPISWDYGLYKILLATLGRSELVLADGESDLVLLERIRECGATVVPIVPSLAAMICALAEREPYTGTEGPSRVRMFTNTGAALPKTTADSLRAAFPGADVVRQFGQTECKRISVLPPEFEDSKAASVGRPLPGTRVRVLADDGSELPTGATGEIVVEGPHVMPGYWRAPEVTARTFRTSPSGEPRLHTGDFGHLDEDGFLYYEGRRDDMFKRRGVRMSTIEIEAAATDIPGVRAAVAVPPDGDRDLAVFVEGEIPPHIVLRELSLRLELAKVPATCQVLEELPLTQHGKHDRKQLARLLEGTPR
ncbi:class I adenylate-forming enzyme family protein [Streptomyces niveus]|uniref:class I adenylate-forming enzyme family protein n=1 Tax=Streptomyces niveus TaxID=193462 RepID=UPI003658C6B8